MKLIQSEKNYFYKLYKNGKKKRISFEIYQKGGLGKSEEELIQELKDAGKYDEWFKKGHCYGIPIRGNRNRNIISRNIISNGKFSPTDYEYTIMDGSIRKFSTIVSSYQNGQINIPVFDFVFENSEEEIIQKLKDAGRYNEWFQKGHCYGIILQNSPSNYEYTLIDGSTNKFSMIVSSYQNGQINIPVFDLVNRKSNKREKKFLYFSNNSVNNSVNNSEEKEIIQKLRDAGKYDEWFKKGHCYGIILPNLDIIREYTVMDGSTKKFSIIVSSYQKGKINTPVFDVGGSNSNYVGQMSFKIVPNSKKLHTFGMSTCSGLTMKLGNQIFLSHIDAITDISEMLSAIHECLRKQKLTTSDISNVKIYRGFEKHNSSYQIINELLEHLSIPKNKIEVIISRDGKCSI